MFTQEQRSEIMSKISSKETLAERIVFRYLRSEGIYFRKHYNRISGKPDIALPRKKIAVFIDGDFWHGRSFDNSSSRLPEIYWKDKIAGNIARDKEVNKVLKERGWKILRVWEKEIVTKKTRNEVLAKVRDFLADGK